MLTLACPENGGVGFWFLVSGLWSGNMLEILDYKPGTRNQKPKIQNCRAKPLTLCEVLAP